MNRDKLKAVVSELAKDIKTEQDLSDLTSQLIKLNVETARYNGAVDALFTSIHHPKK